MDNRLTSFIKEALKEGLPREDISQALVQAGWPEGDIASALDEFAEVDFPIPVPRRRAYGSAREAFLYLLIFLCLFISAYSFGGLLFEFVDRWIPDPLQYGWRESNGIRGYTAALIVAFPLYIWLSSLTARQVKRDPNRRDSKIREWLTYVTLFVAAAIIISDLIALLAGLLQGDLTLRFLLKTLTVLLIAGMVFGYYLWELGQKKKKLTERGGKLKLFVIIVAAMATIAVAMGLYVAGSPSSERARRLDDQRLNDLRSLSYNIDDYYQRNSELPESLNELEISYQPKNFGLDPETGEPYEYRRVNGANYELCAVFTAESDDEDETYGRFAEPMPVRIAEPGYTTPKMRTWEHGAGRHCFELEVPQLTEPEMMPEPKQ